MFETVSGHVSEQSWDTDALYFFLISQETARLSATFCSGDRSLKFIKKPLYINLISEISKKL